MLNIYKVFLWLWIMTQAAASQIDSLKGESNDKIRKLTDWHVPKKLREGNGKIKLYQFFSAIINYQHRC